MASRQVSVTRTLAAPARQIFAVLVDPRSHPRLEGAAMAPAVPGPSRLGPGVRFVTQMKLGIPVPVRNTVVELREGSGIAWEQFGGVRVRFELSALDETSTLVTETLDWSSFPLPALLDRLGLAWRAPARLEARLDRLQSLVTERSGSSPASR